MCLSVFPAAEAKIFLYDQLNQKKVYVADLADLQLTEFLTEWHDVSDFAFDSLEQKLYWVDSASGFYNISRCNVDGSYITLVFSTPQDKPFCKCNNVYLCTE